MTSPISDMRNAAKTACSTLSTCSISSIPAFFAAFFIFGAVCPKVMTAFTCLRYGINSSNSFPRSSPPASNTTGDEKASRAFVVAKIFVAFESL